MTLWVLFGAVRGAEDWQVSGGGYVLGLLVAGGVAGLIVPRRELATARHLTPAGLLVVPGLATLATAGPGAHPDAWWWYTTLVLGLFGAAGTHRLAVEVRRLLCWSPGRRRGRRSALADGAHNR